MKTLRNVTILVTLVLLLGACAGQSARVSYVSMEQEFMAMGQQYDVWYKSGNVDAETHGRAVLLFRSASTLLDSLKLAVLSGQPTSELYLELNKLKTQIIFELTKM